jgi:hypothetical protein
MATKNAKSSKRNSPKLTRREAEKIFNEVMHYQPPVARDRVMDDLEELFKPDSSFSVARRMGTLIAASDGTWFKQITEDREMAVLMAGQLNAVEKAAEALKEVAEVLESGAVRLRVALCAYADIESLYSEAVEKAVIEVSAA